MSLYAQKVLVKRLTIQMTQLNMYGSCITEISECQVPRVNRQLSTVKCGRQPLPSMIQSVKQSKIYFDSRGFGSSAYT